MPFGRLIASVRIVLADYDHENGQLAGRNRSGRWSCGSVLPWTFIGAERLFDLRAVGWKLLPAGEGHCGDMAGG